MPRPSDQAKRRELTDRVRAYLVRNGLAGLSLRPLARALGTSDRMLLYYFGTKEGMVAEALALDERRPLLRAREMLASAESPRDPAGLRRFMEEIWRRFGAPDLRPALPLYLEIMTASLIDPDRYGPVLSDVLTEWTELLTSVFRDLGMPRVRARTEAALLVDATFGLVVAAQAEGGREPADAAFRALLDRLEPGWHVS
ncbi:TetR/AcrR family transcriptional regulator [Streptomyces sp. NBC_00386]|jgi:AcrR family transcriptional regulator|uniref:TetR/AcrR family transcriptional regulator n=1 Tax=Streptomyces sp. NBC_00386 TaxID=2975734 RepID=UPI002E249FEE